MSEEYTFVDADNFTDEDEHDMSTQTRKATKKKQKQYKTGQYSAKAIANAKRKVLRKWTEPEEAHLIRAVQNRPLLYDSCDPEYKEQRAKSNAWQDVAIELGLAGVRSEEAKNKWNYLRNNFKTQLGRYRARISSGECTDDINTISAKWPHFKSMMFVESTAAQSQVKAEQPILEDVLSTPITYIPRTRTKASTPAPLSSPSSSPSPLSARPVSSTENMKDLAAKVFTKMDAGAHAPPNKYRAFTDNIARHMQSLDEDSAFELESIITRNMLEFVAAKRKKSIRLDQISDESIVIRPKYFRSNGRNGWLRNAKKDA